MHHTSATEQTACVLVVLIGVEIFPIVFVGPA